jgi:hypothetical protein
VLTATSSAHRLKSGAMMSPGPEANTCSSWPIVSQYHNTCQEWPAGGEGGAVGVRDLKYGCADHKDIHIYTYNAYVEVKMWASGRGAWGPSRLGTAAGRQALPHPRYESRHQAGALPHPPHESHHQAGAFSLSAARSAARNPGAHSHDSHDRQSASQVGPHLLPCRPRPTVVRCRAPMAARSPLFQPLCSARFWQATARAHRKRVRSRM